MSSVANLEYQPESQPGGVLSKLPKELRLEIYGMVFPPGDIHLFSIRDHLKLAPCNSGSPARRHSSRQTARDFFALLATCRAIHDEAKSMLYENTEFHVNCSWDPASRSSIQYQMGAVGMHFYGNSWRDCSPETHVFSKLQHARSIVIHVYLNTGPMREDSWMHQIHTELSGAIHLRKLHISIRSSMIGPSADFQTQADATMALLGRIQCECPVTAAMDISVGRMLFKSASYYAMLSALKG